MAFIIFLILYGLWLAFAGWIIQINVNTIIAAGQVPDAWPIVWILLILSLSVGGASGAKSTL